MTDFSIPPPPSYPTVQLLLRHGKLIAVLTGLLPIIAAIWLAFEGVPIAVVPAGIVGSALLYLLMRSYVELVTIIADMLLPK